MFIKECVNSVLSQTYKHWELIIVDDCSTDKSVDIIERIAKDEPRIKSFFLDKNIGPASARNIGLNNAQGEYIAFLDSDDSWFPEKLEKQLSFMQEKDIAFSFTSYQPISENGQKKFPIIYAPSKVTYDSYLKNTIIGCLTVIINIEKTGKFEMPEISSSHDMALWLLIMKRGFYAYGLNQNLAYYRVSSKSNTGNKFNAAKDVWRVYREIEKINLAYSIWCFISYVINALKKRI